MPGRETCCGCISCVQLPQHGPDSVQSWLVAGACATSSFFAMGARRSMGFLFVAIRNTFQISRTEASWPIVLISAITLLAGFITGPMAHTFYARPVIIAGSAVSSIGLMLSFFARTNEIMTITLGVIHAGAISEGLGRFVLPFAVDRGLLTKNVALTIILAAEAVTFLLLPFLRTHGLIFAMAIGINFITGAGVVMFPVTLESYFGHEKMSVAYGIVVASGGLQSFVRPSLIGNFRDKVGAYDWIFWICGILSAIAVVVWIAVMAWESRSNNKNVVHHENEPMDTVIANISR